MLDIQVEKTYNSTMNETRSIKVLLTTHRRLKILAAQSGETLLALLERLAIQEEGRLEAMRLVVRSEQLTTENRDES